MNEETLANIAHQISRVGESEAARSVRLLADTIIDPTPDQRVLLGRLYRHFMKDPVKPRSPFKWLTQATTTGDPKFELEVVLVTDGYAAATNGFVFHVWEDPDLEPGFYDKRGHLIDKAFRFPQIKQAFMEEDRRVVCRLRKLRVSESGDVAVRVLDGWFDRYRLITATGNPHEALVQASDGPGHRMRVKGPFEDTHAILMPLRI
jgi:hypothetical protein